MANRPAASDPPARPGRLPADVIKVALSGIGAFAGFFGIYTSATLIFAEAALSAGTMVTVLMAVVVLVQPLVAISSRWTVRYDLMVGWSLVCLVLGPILLGLGVHIAGVVFAGAGFGVFVVAGTAWTKDVAPAGSVGQALGIYGFGNAVGAAIGAPIALFLAQQFGLVGVAAGSGAFAFIGLFPVIAAARPRVVRADPGAVVDLNAADQPRHSAETPDLPTTPQRTGGTAALNAGSLVAHLIAVTIYGALLSSAPTLTDSEQGAVIIAFALPASMAIGRLASGVLTDRWSGVGTGGIGLVIVLAAMWGIWTVSAPVAVVIAAGLIGAASGAVQTAALALMMREANSPQAISRVSAVWNIAFDVALGIGAVAAGFLFAA